MKTFYFSIIFFFYYEFNLFWVYFILGVSYFRFILGTGNHLFFIFYFLNAETTSEMHNLKV